MPSAAYEPRRPQETALWRIVREHLGDFFEYVKEEYGSPLPKYVKNAFFKFLKCGDHQFGFVACHCDGCGHEILVAFSCKERGVCPSCATRRMANEAAHITDRILPNVPIRQYVLSMPMGLRALCATDAKVLTAMNRIFVEEVSKRYSESGAPGSITFVQRFGGSLNANTHLHTLFLDGGFVENGKSLSFVESEVPTVEELHSLVIRIHARAMKWLRKHGHVKEDVEARDPTALEACTQLAMSGGNFLGTSEPDAHEKDERHAQRKQPFAARYEHFDVHCGVRIEKNDDEGRERLVRYCARPVLALDRLELLPDGNISYRVKYPRRGRKFRVMTPVEFLARLASLVPPPRYPLIRYAGVLGPGARLRPRVVPVPTKSRPRCIDGNSHELEPREKRETQQELQSEEANAALVMLTKEPEPTEWNILTVAHWERLANGALVAASRYVNWQILLARTFGFDALKCPRCEGRLRVMATITDRTVAKEILDHVRKARAPPLAA